MAKRISLSLRENKILCVIFVCFIYTIVSLSTFLAVKCIFPVIPNFGLNSISLLPTFFTYIIPLFLMFMVLLFIHATKVENRRRIILIAGLTLLLLGAFGIIMSIILMTIIYNGRVIVGNLTYLFPLDVLLINIIYVFIGIGLLVLKHIDNRNKIIGVTNTKSVPKQKIVLLGFYLPFATYFFGQCLYGINYLFEGYFSSNWYGLIPAYALFASLTFALVLFVYYYHSKKHDNTRRALVSIFSSLLFVSVFGVWFLIAAIANPYLLAESLQYELSILYAMKYPLGLLVAALWVLIPTIYYLIKVLIKISKEKKANHE